MTGKEIANKAFDFIQEKDEKGFNDFMDSLSDEEIESFKVVMDEYKKIMEKAQQW